jgi:tetratricopeptide (TPR) repeat protein
MGVVYEAEQISLGRRVALKVLPFAATMDPRHLKRFHNEARAAACLEHPHIVPVFAVGCERAVHFYAMKLIEGRSLAEVIALQRRAHRPRPSGGGEQTAPVAAASTEPAPRDTAYYRRVAEWGVQAAEALEYAHGVGIVHRDVKPANLMLDGRGSLWVTDFGLARTAQSDLTVSGDLVGTLRYMSPEQALAKHGLVDHRTDVYSLGATLYELLTLRPAVSGKDRQELLHNLAFEEPAAPRRLEPALPRDLETVVLKALAKDPGERYARALDLAADLGRFLNDEPIRARRPTLARRAERWARRHRALIWAAAGFLAALGALAASAGWVAHDRAGRQARTAAAVQAALEEGRRCLKERKWPLGQAAARRAEALLAGGDCEEELRQGASELLDDLRLAARLEEVRLLQSLVKDGRFDNEGADRGYASAFRDHGMDVENPGRRQAVALIGARAIRVELATALDGWAQTRRCLPDKGGPSWRDLLVLAREVDPDLGRRALRDAVLQGDRRSLAARAASCDPREVPPVTLVLHAECLAETGGLPEAVALLRRAREQHADDFWINHALGQYLVSSRPLRWDEALPFFLAAAALRPDSPGARLNLGNAFAGRGRLGEALAAYRKAVELKPDYAEAHQNIGQALRQLGRHDEAVAAFRQSIALQPGLGIAHFNLANALASKGLDDEALPAYRRASELRPDLVEAHNQLGLILTDRGRLDEAITALRKAVDARPDSAVPHYNLGNALWKKGRLDDAAAAYRRAIELKPDYAKAHCNLGQVLRRQGQFARALESLKRGHELGSRRRDWTYPSGDWVRECRRLIELDGREDGVLRGESQPADAVERTEYAQLCYCKKRYAAAARLWADAFRAEPKLARDLQAAHRYNAARAAGLAGCGQGEDAGGLAEKERAGWRRLALSWLRADLALRARQLESGQPADRVEVERKLRQWQYDSALAGLRDAAAVALLPAEERPACARLRADVEALLAKADRARQSRPPPNAGK